MLNKLLPLTLLPLIAFAQPAEARRLFWWELPEAPQSAPHYNPVYGAQEDTATPDDLINQREYELYRRQMLRRYRGYDADLMPEDLPYQPQPRLYSQPQDLAPLAPPLTPKPKPKKLAKAKPVAKQAPASTQQATAAPAKKAGPVTCDKGAAIVSSFGFSDVKSKTCEADTLAYLGQRSGKPFQIDVNPKTGELIAVKKLEVTGAVEPPPVAAKPPASAKPGIEL